MHRMTKSRLVWFAAGLILASLVWTLVLIKVRAVDRGWAEVRLMQAETRMVERWTANITEMRDQCDAKVKAAQAEVYELAEAMGERYTAPRR